MKNLATFIIGLVVFTAPLTVSADTFVRPLTVGSRGEDVSTLQKILFDAGFLKVAPTGYFGVLTKAAVTAYQKLNGLEQVGSVGPKTRAILNAHIASGASVQTPAPEVTVPMQPANIPVTTQPTTTQSTSTTPQTSTTTASEPAPAASPNDPPKLTLVAPVTAVPRTQFETTLSVATDKPALCRYGTLEGMNLSAMNAFTNSASTLHSTTLTQISPDAYYIYYVRCEDFGARQSQDLKVEFWTNGQ
jgi:hypothetical protein